MSWPSSVTGKSRGTAEPDVEALAKFVARYPHRFEPVVDTERFRVFRVVAGSGAVPDSP